MFGTIGAFFNWWFRGGGGEASTGKNFSAGKIVNAAAFGLAAFWQTGNWPALLIHGGAMALGQAPGWRQYISAMRQDGVLNNRGVWWGIGHMTLRGLFWGACLAAAGGVSYLLAYTYHLSAPCVLWLSAGLLQGVIYFGVIWFYRVTKLPQNKYINDWTLAEILHGLVLWLPLHWL